MKNSILNYFSLLLIHLCLYQYTQAQVGSLDSSFGHNGKLQLDLGINVPVGVHIASVIQHPGTSVTLKSGSGPPCAVHSDWWMTFCAMKEK